MRRILAIALLVVLGLGATADAQETYFGKNKVRYKDFNWSYIQTRHFDVYFYEDAYPTAKFTTAVMESAYVEITDELGYSLQNRVPVFIYNSHNDFQQTNITPGMLPEGVGGFTEAFKKRIVIPFTGSYEDYRHVLHHELTHAVIFDMLFGKFFSSMLARQRIFNIPLWYSEGYAEYSSRHGWDTFSDMFVRDATINGYLAPPLYLGGFLAYKQGQSMIKYIADKYGEEKLGDIIRKGKVNLSLTKALKETLGVTLEEFWENYSKEMKRRYWPEIARRKEANEIGTRLTHARKDGSFFNEKPVYSPDGDNIAIFTDRSDYTELVLISAKDGKMVSRLIQSARSGDLESLHSYVSGASFSPDGSKLVLVAKSKGKESLVFLDVRKRKVTFTKRYDFGNIIGPAWSPDGKSIAFGALKGFKRDLYIYDIESDMTKQLTDDRGDDLNPSWMPDSDELIFQSDRPHPETKIVKREDHLYARPGAVLPGDFEYGSYNLFSIKLDDQVVEPIMVGPGPNRTPIVSPDGSKIAFVSTRNGIDNIYIGYLDSTEYYAVTDILSGVNSLSWSPNGKRIAFSAFFRGGFDVFVLKELVPAGENGVLENTDFIDGKYDLLTSSRSMLAGKKIKSDAKLTEITNPPEETDNPLDTSVVVSIVEPDNADSTVQIAAAIPEDSTAEQTEPPVEETTQDSLATNVITKTGIHDDEFVFVSSASDPLDTLMFNVAGDSSQLGYVPMEEPLSFDSIPLPTTDGEYKIHKYKAKLSTDYVGGGVAYDTFFGLRGQTVFLFSDYLGDHQIYVATDLVNTIDQSYVQAFYFNNKKRTGLGVGFFHTKNFYIDNSTLVTNGSSSWYPLFSDRFYGFSLMANRPSSVFSRFEGSLSEYFIDREYIDSYDLRKNRSSKVTVGEVAYVTDNIIWGMTGPVNGRRAKLTLEGGINLFDSDDVEFVAASFDYRKYWHFNKTFTLAVRVTGGASEGKTAKQYFLGGTTNFIGNRTLDADVIKVENLYFSEVVTPLRGLDYYELQGDRFGLINMEFRFPLIDYFVMRFPLPITLARVGGVAFADMGSAWFGNNFKFGTSQGDSRLLDVHTSFGFGMRANLGFLLLRYDLAWLTNFNAVSAHPTSYFSFGADF